MTIDLSNSKNFAPFDGDGRRRMNATENTKKMFPGMSFQTCTTAAARRVIETFVAQGRHRFGEHGNFAWVPICWCATQNLRYRTIHHPIGGWYVVLDTVLDDPEDPEPEQESLESGDFSPFGDGSSAALDAYYRELYGADLDDEDINQLAKRLRM